MSSEVSEEHDNISEICPNSTASARPRDDSRRCYVMYVCMHVCMVDIYMYIDE